MEKFNNLEQEGVTHPSPLNRPSRQVHWPAVMLCLRPHRTYHIRPSFQTKPNKAASRFGSEGFVLCVNKHTESQTACSGFSCWVKYIMCMTTITEVPLSYLTPPCALHCPAVMLCVRPHLNETYTAYVYVVGVTSEAVQVAGICLGSLWYCALHLGKLESSVTSVSSLWVIFIKYR